MKQLLLFIYFYSSLISQDINWRVTLPLGKVLIKEQNNAEWAKAKVNHGIHAGDEIKSGSRSRCEIKNRKKHILRVGENSNIILDHNENEQNAFKVINGKVWYNYPGKNRDVRTEIRTPTAVAAIRGTVYNLEVSENVSDHYVLEGKVNLVPVNEDGVSVDDTTIVVNEGEMVRMVKDFDQYLKDQERKFLEFKDEFEIFKLKQSKDFNKFLISERDAFKQFKNISISKTKIDSAEFNLSDWVKWNKDLDGSID